MGITDIIIPVLYGVVVVFIIGWLCFVVWWVLNYLGLTKYLKRQPKVTEAVYVYVATAINEGKSFEEIMQPITKYDIKKQQPYIEAYMELKSVKGGTD